MSKAIKSKMAWKEYFYMFAGTAVMAVAINGIYDRAQLVTGGFTGLSIVIKNISSIWLPGGMPLGLTNILLNIPLFIGALWLQGKHFILRTIFATAAVSVWLSVLPGFTVLTDDLLLSAIFGGILAGAGIGMVLSANATTGGTDLLAVLIQRKLRQFNVVEIMQVIDAAIVLVGASVFGIKKALYAIIAVYIASRVSQMFTEGMKFAKVVYIISDAYEEVAKGIMEQVDRGVTALPATGMYSGAPKNMLFCVVNRKEIVTVKDIVKEIDTQAFVFVGDTREVLGEGFMEHS